MKHPHKLFLIGLILIANIFAIEKLIVSEINFDGNSFLTDHDLQSVIKLQSPGLFMRSEFTPKKLQRDKISLEAYYKSNGFLNIVITAKYELPSKLISETINFSIAKMFVININPIKHNLWGCFIYNKILFGNSNATNCFHLVLRQ